MSILLIKLEIVLEFKPELKNQQKLNFYEKRVGVWCPVLRFGMCINLKF